MVITYKWTTAAHLFVLNSYSDLYIISVAVIKVVVTLVALATYDIPTNLVDVYT